MRAELARAAATCALLSAAACDLSTPARDQWLVTLHTDAPIPQFGQFVFVEILPEGSDSACVGCQRVLSADAAAQWPLSFGVPASSNGAPRVRARLYRAAVAGPSGPSSDRVVDALFHLPSAHEVTDVDATLAMSCFGVAADVAGDMSCDPDTGALAPTGTAAALASSDAPSPGSWAPAAARGCAATDDAMVCIPGGAFLLGSPDFLPAGDASPAPEQLVEVAPFEIDANEMTVGEYRALVTSGAVAAPTTNLPYCTYAKGDMSAAMNCVSRTDAVAACAAKNKRLPTEAEWEWAAGNRDLESDYPWTEASLDICSNAVVGLADPADNSDVENSSECLAAGEAPGPKAGGNASDLTALGLLNMGGNLGEWVADDFVPYSDESCWGASARLHDGSTPCTSGTTPAYRGGAWRYQPAEARATFRGSRPNENGTEQIGVRCARSM